MLIYLNPYVLISAAFVLSSWEICPESLFQCAVRDLYRPFNHFFARDMTCA